MIDSHDPVDVDSSTPDPLDALIADMAHAMPPIAGDSLIGRVRTRIDVRARRRRRTVRTVVSVASIAAIVAAVGLLASASHSPTSQVSAIFSEDVAPGNLVVVPASDLRDGQTVQATAYGFDTGTNVQFLDCIDGPGGASQGTSDMAPAWLCRPPTRATAHALTDTPGNGSTDGLTRATASLTLTTSASDFTVQVRANGTITGHGAPTGGAGMMQGLCGSRIGGTTARSGPPAPPVVCRVIAVGTRNGRTGVFVGEPLRFIGATSTGTPGTSSSAPATTPASGAPSVCSASPDHASLRVTNIQSDGVQRGVDSKSITGAPATELFEKLCSIRSTAPDAKDLRLTNCPTASPKLDVAFVTFTDQGRPVTVIEAAVAGCAYWGSAELGQVSGLGVELPTYRAGITAIGAAFDVDLTQLLAGQPTADSPTPTTVSGG
ncbi:MAG: hypothetical protein JST73_08970 [Actinobacteria bacterium]|nr:hypothetical protein [Actinomycetota bacterium]